VAAPVALVAIGVPERTATSAGFLASLPCVSLGVSARLPGDTVRDTIGSNGHGRSIAQRSAVGGLVLTRIVPASVDRANEYSRP
jgi:hypothetical protein